MAFLGLAGMPQAVGKVLAARTSSREIPSAIETLLHWVVIPDWLRYGHDRAVTALTLAIASRVVGGHCPLGDTVSMTASFRPSGDQTGYLG